MGSESLFSCCFDPNGDLFYDRTKFLPVRLFPDMIRALGGKRRKKAVCHRCRPCLCRQRPVWEWGISSELSLRSLRAVREPCSGWDLGDLWFLHGICGGSPGASIQRKRSALRRISRRSGLLYPQLCGAREKKKLKHSVVAVLFALSGLICWGGISQVINNSVASAFKNAFGISPMITTVILVVLSAVIVLRKMQRSARWM